MAADAARKDKTPDMVRARCERDTERVERLMEPNRIGDDGSVYGSPRGLHAVIGWCGGGMTGHGGGMPSEVPNRSESRPLRRRIPIPRKTKRRKPLGG